MNHLRIIPFYLFAFLLLTSCEKEIELDYHQVDALYVVEASISNNGTEVRVSQTNAMDDNNSSSDISNATVTLTTDNGQQWNIPYSRNGFYRSSTIKGEAGTTYTIDVALDGQHFTSTSTMQKTPILNKFRFVWMKAASERILFGDLRLQDIPNEDNWYFLHIYRNGIGYRWAVMRDDQNPNKELQQLFTFFREGSSDNDVLQEGDNLRIQIRAIDQRAYDYLYSMQIMDNTGTNPIPNFTGGCLGYFSAYHQITYDCIYHLADAEEDD
ncbi:MAG: DUF4249 domain-containing protein [Prevotella sp.]|nr:DUF4249 domain-containing protein [Prevotella sp.]